MDLFHQIRIAGNQAAHAHANEYGLALTSLKITRELTKLGVYHNVPWLNPASSRARGKARSTGGRQNHYSNTASTIPSVAFEDEKRF
jgi:hypothetical protein